MAAATTRRSAEQERYAKAQERIETIRDAVRLYMNASGLKMDTEADIDAYCDAEVAIEDELGYQDALDEMTAARRALFAWAKGRVGSEAPREVLAMFDEIRTHPGFAEKLAGVCMQIPA